MMKILLSIIALSMTTPPALSQQVFVKGPSEEGQGFVFYAGRCYLLTAGHVVGSDSTGRVEIYIGGITVSAAAPRNQTWQFSDLDVVILEVSDPALCRKFGTTSSPPSQDQLLFRERSGTLRYLPITRAGQSPDGRYLIRDASSTVGSSCNNFGTGRSGSLVTSKENGLIGLLIETKNCVGFVAPINVINQAVSLKLQIRLPLHERSDQLIVAAFEADEPTFYRLLDAIGDPNSTNGDGSLPLTAVATANGFYKFKSQSGPPRAGESPTSWETRVCGMWMEARLRIANELLRRGARIDGAGGSSWTPLMNATTDDSGCGNERMVELLLSKGASPNHLYLSPYSNTPNTPLNAAVTLGFLQKGRGSQPIVETLIRFGASAKAKVEGMTPIMALALDSSPSEYTQGDSSCWSADNSKVAVFRLLARHSDLSQRLDSEGEYKGLTTSEILKRRLGGGCARPQCDGTGRGGRERCLERMLGALSQ